MFSCILCKSGESYRLHTSQFTSVLFSFLFEYSNLIPMYGLPRGHRNESHVFYALAANKMLCLEYEIKGRQWKQRPESVLLGLCVFGARLVICTLHTGLRNKTWTSPVLSWRQVMQTAKHNYYYYYYSYSSSYYYYYFYYYYYYYYYFYYYY